MCHDLYRTNREITLYFPLLSEGSILFSALRILSPKGWCKNMNLDEVICYCQNVTSGMIKNAVDHGATTLAEVQEITGAGTVCGSCIDNVQRLVEQFAAERADQ